MEGAGKEVDVGGEGEGGGHFGGWGLEKGMG